MTPTIPRTFGANRFGGSVTQHSLGKPAAVYPGAVATDSDMIIAVDRQQTRLALPMSTTDSSMTVVDPSVIAAYSLLTIDLETVKVTGAPAGNVVPISRAFDGSTAAVHLASAVVSGFVDAYHHNRLVAEVEAIEQALGANLSRIPGSAWIISSNFIFPAQSPGGTLVAGNNPITLAPVPAGVNGTDQNHYLYISGGTGAAEPVLITGGSAVAGAPSGTLIVNCANAHSGAWTIQSATAGIQEAISSLPAAGYGGGLVVIPQGTWTIYSTITVSRGYIGLRGFNRVSTTLSTSMTTGPLLSYPAGTDQCTLSDLNLAGPSAGSTFAVNLVSQTNFVIDRLSVSGFHGGISVTGANAYGPNVTNSFITAYGGDAVYINSSVGGGIWTNIILGGNNTTTTVGFHISNGVGIYLTHTYAIGVGTGMVLDPSGTSGVVGVIQAFDTYFDGYHSWTINGILIEPGAGATVNTLSFFGGAVSGMQNVGVYFYGPGTAEDISFTNFTVSDNNGGGVSCTPLSTMTVKNLFLTDCWVEANSGTTPGAQAGVSLAFATNVVIRGGVYAAGSFGNGVNNQSYGISVGGATTNVHITEAVVWPNMDGAIQIVGTNPGLTVKNCIGYNPVGQLPITVGASPFTYTNGPCPATVYISGGTVSSVGVAGGSTFTIVATASPCQIRLAPNEKVQVAYSVAPTIMVADVE